MFNLLFVNPVLSAGGYFDGIHVEIDRVVNLRLQIDLGGNRLKLKNYEVIYLQALIVLQQISAPIRRGHFGIDRVINLVLQIDVVKRFRPLRLDTRLLREVGDLFY
jgi:hypothetical protein